MPRLVYHQPPTLILQSMPPPKVVRPMHSVEEPFKVHAYGFPDYAGGELFVDLFVDRVEAVVLRYDLREGF
jgi:hypothetical protein